MSRRRKPNRRLTDRDISKASHHPRLLTTRQLQVLREAAKGGTQYQAYLRLLDNDPSWTAQTQYGPADLSFLNFKQHLTNAYGRLHVSGLKEAIEVWGRAYELN